MIDKAFHSLGILIIILYWQTMLLEFLQQSLLSDDVDICIPYMYTDWLYILPCMGICLAYHSNFRVIGTPVSSISYITSIGTDRCVYSYVTGAGQIDCSVLKLRYRLASYTQLNTSIYSQIVVQCMQLYIAQHICIVESTNHHGWYID